MKRGKYNAVRTKVDGITFASKREAKRYSDLLQLQKAGKIASLELQPKFPIYINDIKVFEYRGDFRYMVMNSAEIVTEDVKGVRTAIYKFKKKCVEAQYGIEITEV